MLMMSYCSLSKIVDATVKINRLTHRGHNRRVVLPDLRVLNIISWCWESFKGAVCQPDVFGANNNCIRKWKKLSFLIYYKIVMEVWFCDHHEKTVIDISYLFDIVFCKQKRRRENYQFDSPRNVGELWAFVRIVPTTRIYDNFCLSVRIVLLL